MRRTAGTGRWAVRAVAACVALGVGGSAQAFYFRGWPGDGLPRTDVVIKPGISEDANPPSGRPRPGFVEEPTPPGTKTPSAVPEPATLVLAAVGALVVVGRRMRKARG